MRRFNVLLLLQQAILLLACAVLVGIALYSKEQMNEAAGRTYVAKDVTADIIPPPMYLVEARLVVSRGIEGTLSAAETV